MFKHNLFPFQPQYKASARVFFMLVFTAYLNCRKKPQLNSRMVFTINWIESHRGQSPIRIMITNILAFVLAFLAVAIKVEGEKEY